MSFRAKAVVLLWLFGAGAAFLWFRHPNMNTLAPAPLSQRSQVSKENVSKLVPQAAGTAADSSHVLQSANNDFEFVADSAKKALDGDGKAARRIGDVLLKCVPTKIQYRDKPDPQAALESDLAGQKSPEWIKDRMRTKFLECRDFIRRSAFGSTWHTRRMIRLPLRSMPPASQGSSPARRIAPAFKQRSRT